MHPHCFELDIDMEGVLVLDSLTELVDFQNKYYKTIEDHFFGGLDWRKVKEDYKGIEIQNYSKWEGRILSRSTDIMSSMWYSTWDVSSGCLWDLSNLKSAKPCM